MKKISISLPPKRMIQRFSFSSNVLLREILLETAVQSVLDACNHALDVDVLERIYALADI